MDVWPGLPGHGIGGIGRLGLGKNLGPPLHDFNHFKRCQGKCVYLGGVFLSFWGSDGGPWGHGCAAWPPWMWMRLDEAADWVWVRIEGRRDMILITFKGARGNASI